MQFVKRPDKTRKSKCAVDSIGGESSLTLFVIAPCILQEASKRWIFFDTEIFCHQLGCAFFLAVVVKYSAANINRQHSLREE